MANGNTPHVGTGEQASPQCQPCRILLADDDTFMRRMNEGVLSRSGYHVVAVEDGEKGWSALHAGGFDLLITDNDMPNLTGVELVKKVRTARMALPVILTTGVMPDEELKRHPWLQIAATLLKPFSIEELLQTVADVLRIIETPSPLTAPQSDRESRPPDDGS